MSFYLNFEKQRKRIYLCIICLVDVLNQHTCSLSKLKEWCRVEARLLMFKLSGRCRHSGQCCHHIQIKHKHKIISSLYFFNALKKQNKVFSRFLPVVSDNNIDYFNCKSLTSDNLCSDYSTRPNFCRNYPLSVLFSNDKLHPGCGFYFSKQFSLPTFSTSDLKKQMWMFEFNNLVQ